MSTTEIALIVSASDRASGVLAGVGSSLQNLGQKATRLGVDLLPISAASGVVAGSALKMAADYEQSMNILQATSGATAGQMQKLNAAAIALGADIRLPGTSAKDAADAMLELSKAGLSVNDTMSAARGVLQMSAAAQIGNAQAAEITANALNMFRLSGDKATMVADLLAAGANRSSAGILDMADALKMSGAVASMAGLSIDQLTTAIALMANQGIKGSDAGTSLKQMLLSLQAPTDKARELMGSLGISVFDARGQMLPMPELIGQFSGALGGLTQEQRNAALATIFGSDAVRAANIILMGGTEAWNEMAGAVTAGGEAAALAAAQNAGLNGALDGLRSTLETVLLTGARPLLEVLTPMVIRVSELVGAFATAHPEIVTAGLAFAGLMTAAAPIALAVGAISTALGALLSPIGLVVVAVAGLAAAWALDFGGIQSKTGEVLEFVRGLVTEVIGYVQAFITTTIEGTRATWEETWTLIQGTVQTVLEAIRVVVSTVLTAVQTFIAAHGEEITLTLQNAWTSISEIVNTATQIIQTVVNAVLPAIAGFIQEHGDQIQAILSAAWTFVRTIVETTLRVIQGIMTAVLAVMQGDWSTAWTAVQGVAQAVWTAIQTIITTALNLILGFFGTNLAEVQTLFTTAWTAIQTTITTITTAISTYLSTTWTAISTTASTIWTGVATALSTIWAGIRTTANTIWTGLTDGIRTKVNQLGADVYALTGGLRTGIVAVWEDIKGRVLGVVGDMIGSIKGAFAGFKIHIPLPHFSVSWNDIGFGVKIPKVGVNWYGKGGDFVTNGPMLIGVGEMGPERVQITPLGQQGRGDGEARPQIAITINNPVVREESDIRRLAEAVSEVLAGQTQTYKRVGLTW